jgi:hypothetical protein
VSLARRHYQQVTAAQAAAATDPGEPINASAYELMLVKLAEDQRKLRSQQSIERRIEIKRVLLPEYEPWVAGVLSTGRGGQDAVLMTIMVWRIDVGDYAGALAIAEYALAHNLAMPDQYKRAPATAIAEEIADRALAPSDNPVELTVLQRVEQLTGQHDMPDEVRAKLHKAIGNALAAVAGTAPFDAPRHAQAAQALAYYRRALQLHDRVGVKKDMERIVRELKKSPVPKAAEPGASADPAHAPAPATYTDEAEAAPGNAAADIAAVAAPIALTSS